MATELAAHVAVGLHGWFPAHVAAMGDAALGRFVGLAVERAAYHHALAARAGELPPRGGGAASLAQDSLRFAGTMVMLGSGFETDGLLPWAAEILAAEGREATWRIQTLFRATLTWREETAGPHEHHLEAALRRIRAHPFMQAPSEEVGDEEIIAFVEQVYPERAKVAPRAALGRLPGQARALAERHGIADERAPAMLAVLLFMLGHAIDEDPQYPWVKRALTAPLERGVGRVWRLYADAMVYVERVLATAKKGRR